MSEEIIETVENEIGEVEGEVEEAVGAVERGAEEVSERSTGKTGGFFTHPLTSIWTNKFNFIANYRGEGNLLVVEPYIWYFIGIIISIVLLANGGAENMSSELSWLWIVVGIFIIIVVASGKHKAEG